MKELKLGIEKIRGMLTSEILRLRPEGDSSVLYGKSEGKYKMFQLELNPLATAIVELVKDGVQFESLLESLVDAGQTKHEAISNIKNVIDICNFQRSNKKAIRLDSASVNLSAPLNVTWDITNVCNLKCSHCYNYSGPMGDDSLSVEQCLDIVDQLADLGVMHVWLGGGEPLMKKGIQQILRKMKQRDLRIILATNGSLVNRSDFLEVISETCTEVNISLDGSTPESHSFLRGSTAVLQESLDAISMIKEYCGKGVYVTALTVVHSENISEVPDIIDLAYRTGCDKWTHDELYAMGRGASLNKYVLTHDGYDKLYSIVAEKTLEYSGRMNVENYVRMHKYTEPGSAKPFYGCAAGTQEIAIQPDGSVYPCQKLQIPKYFCGNVLEKSITDIWHNHPIMKWLRSRDVEQTQCSGCGSFASGTCNGGCLAEKETVFGRHDVRDPLCPDNRGEYEDILRRGKIVILKPLREIIPV